MQTAITISWDAEQQLSGVQLNPNVVKNWDFCLAVLDMARRAAEDARRALLMQNLQQQALAQQQHEAVRGTLLRGR